jgi:hypothetical protein
VLSFSIKRTIYHRLSPNDIHRAILMIVEQRLLQATCEFVARDKVKLLQVV